MSPWGELIESGVEIELQNISKLLFICLFYYSGLFAHRSIQTHSSFILTQNKFYWCSRSLRTADCVTAVQVRGSHRERLPMCEKCVWVSSQQLYYILIKLICSLLFSTPVSRNFKHSLLSVFIDLLWTCLLDEDGWISVRELSSAVFLI